MNIYVVCPANCATGGTEALHGLAAELNKIDDVNARIWYWDIRSDPPMPDEFGQYECEYVTELPDNHDVIVFPEIWANKALVYSDCVRAVWWLGIDAYAGWTQRDERGAFLKDDSIIHIAQSEYARDFLNKLGAHNVLKCDDTVNMDFYAEYDEVNRNNDVIYNPVKATPFMDKIIAECPDITFKPIKGMTRSEVIDTMRHSKLYVDFGEFPGRERMPREAALCGCCLITGKIGSAAYIQDFAHDYKFDSKDSHLWAIANKIRYVLNNYDSCHRDFDLFRESLRADIDRIPKQYKKILEAFNEV